MTRKDFLKLIFVGSSIASSAYSANFTLDVIKEKNSILYQNSYREGIHYEVLNTPLKSPVNAVIQFFWYGSPGSQNVEGPIKKWITKAQGNITLKQIPGTLNTLWLDGARTYYSLERLNLLDSMQSQFFKAYKSGVIHDKASTELFLARKGINVDSFWEEYYSSSSSLMLKKYSLIAKNANLKQIPTFIVSGKYSVKTSAFSNWEDVFSFTEYLIKTQPTKNPIK